MTIEDEVFEQAVNPYGHPVISFISETGDSTIYMTPGHHPPTRRIVATWNWLMRNDHRVFLVPVAPSQLLEWSWATYTPNEEDPEVFLIELSQVEQTDFPVTFMEF